VNPTAPDLMSNLEQHRIAVDAESYSQRDAINILDVVVAPLRHRRKIARFALAVAILTSVVMLLSPNVYTGTTKILTPQQNQSIATALLSQLGPLAGLTGQNLNMKSASDLYVAMLESRTIGDALNSRFQLRALYQRKTDFDTLNDLKKLTSIQATKDGIITIEVDDKDPNRAAALANAYVEELFKLTQNLAITEAGQRRLFFEKQLKQVRDDLAQAEFNLRKTQERTGLIEIESQAKAIVQSIAAVRARIAATEVQIQTMKSYAAEDNSDLRRLQQQLTGLRVQLARLEKNNQGGDGDIQIATRRLPQVGLDYMRSYREVKYNETLFEMMAKQYEIAKIDESKSAPIVQVMDKATVPEKKTKPARTVTVLLLTLVAAFLGMIWSWAKELGGGLANDPRNAEKLAFIRATLFGTSWRDAFNPRRWI
jgi:tyrosine-protein kinase Etk/Wzc